MTPAPTYDSFRNLVLTVRDAPVDAVTTVRRYELRAGGKGAEVWITSALEAGGEIGDADPRFCGWLTSRQVIELLIELERSGIYDLPDPVSHDNAVSLVSMRLSAARRTHDVIDRAPADEGCVSRVVGEIVRLIGQAQERALVFAG